KSRSVCSLRWVQTIGDRSGRRDLRAAGVPGTQSDHRLTRGMSRQRDCFQTKCQREKKMTAHVPDRFKAANAFWIGLGKIGLTPAAVLSQARLPLTVYDGKYADLPTHTSFTVFRISSGGQIAHFFRLKLRRHAGKN